MQDTRSFVAAPIAHRTHRSSFRQAHLHNIGSSQINGANLLELNQAFYGQKSSRGRMGRSPYRPHFNLLLVLSVADERGRPIQAAQRWLKDKRMKTNKTLAFKIRQILNRMSKYFTSGEIIMQLRLAYSNVTSSRGAINAAIDSLAKKHVLTQVRHGSGRRDSIWTLA
jgi:hypothetical protein